MIEIKSEEQNYQQSILQHNNRPHLLTRWREVFMKTKGRKIDFVRDFVAESTYYFFNITFYLFIEILIFEKQVALS